MRKSCLIPEIFASGWEENTKNRTIHREFRHQSAIKTERTLVCSMQMIGKCFMCYFHMWNVCICMSIWLSYCWEWFCQYYGLFRYTIHTFKNLLQRHLPLAVSLSDSIIRSCQYSILESNINLSAASLNNNNNNNHNKKANPPNEERLITWKYTISRVYTYLSETSV